jgi:drug/metabolite transporter (DMT)-like permease
MPSEYKYPLLLLLQAFLISTIYPAIKLFPQVDSMAIGWLRVIWGVVGLGLVLLIQKKDWKIEKKDVLPLSLIGTIGLGLVWFLVIVSTRVSGSAITALLVNTSPFWALGIGFIVGKDKFIWKQVTGMLLTIIGVGLIIFYQNGATLTFDLETLWGYLIAFAAAFGIGFYGVFVSKYVQKYGGLRSTFWGLVFSAISFTLFVIFSNPNLLYSFISFEGLIVGIYTGFMVTAIPQLITAIALGKIKPSVVFIYNLTIPVFTVIMDYLLFGELITMPFVVGAVLVLAGVYVTQVSREKVSE